MVHLAIIDRSRVFADALADRLETEPDLRVLCCTTGTAALLQTLGNSSIDVVVADAALFEPDRLADAGAHRPRLRSVDRAPDIRTIRGTPLVVLLADDEDRRMLVPAVEAGIRGWVPRSASVVDLVEAIRAVVGGGTSLPPPLLTDVLRALVWTNPQDDPDPDQALVESLTPRERQVLACLADGLGRREVAERLGMSTNTVRTHVQSILAKLGVTSALAAVAFARRVITPLDVVPV